MKLTKEEYAEMLGSQSPPSNLLLDMVWAFVVGGLICTIGQAVSEFYKSRGLDQTAVSAATAITLVFLGGLLTALHLYDKIAKKAGAGTLVPITGFSNAIVSPAMEFKSEGFVLGLGAKLFAIAGPVLVYGISASVIYGLILFFIS
ncbi:stage V sporulation protein AC [Butyricicoccus pullicaecorum]|uniref:Stage V sporulation protein AC n=1 Tax=Butyricicoccus pullicaecorum TaxID=501571 RepID=A0A1Y4L5P2_9FIRM|nr:stage V sporulation protein AC [Butyricicoccus pullicaecorum]OUP51986.1 stage V sporulation protein AC [Butyricicoccus pullicaecorum]